MKQNLTGQKLEPSTREVSGLSLIHLVMPHEQEKVQVVCVRVRMRLCGVECMRKGPKSNVTDVKVDKTCTKSKGINIPFDCNGSFAWTVADQSGDRLSVP